MTVEAERRVDAALERILHDEVEAVQMVQLVAHHGTLQQFGKRRLDALSGQLRLNQQIITGIIGPDRDVRGVALVAGAGMGNLVQLDFARHATSTFTLGRTRSRSISAECVTTDGVICPR